GLSEHFLDIAGSDLHLHKAGFDLEASFSENAANARGLADSFQPHTRALLDPERPDAGGRSRWIRRDPLPIFTHFALRAGRLAGGFVDRFAALGSLFDTGDDGIAALLPRPLHLIEARFEFAELGGFLLLRIRDKLPLPGNQRGALA